jgi:putative endonuclease
MEKQLLTSCFCFMYWVYVLYSTKFGKIYIGYTANLEQRILSHNSLSKKGFTAKYRPWELIRTEVFETKREALIRERQLKTAAGRKFIWNIVAKSSGG